MRGILQGTMLVALLVPTAAAAQPTSDARHAPIAEGQRVRVTDESGRTITARVRAISQSGLMLQDGSTNAEIPYGAIVKIDRPRDRVWDGALAGFAIGAGIGLIGIAAEEKDTSCQPDTWFCGASFGPPASAVVVMLGGIGAGIGAGVDALIGRKKTLFERGRQVRVTPVVGRGGAAARVAIAW